MIIQSDNFGQNHRIRCGIHEHTHNYGSHIHQSPELLYVLDGSIESTVDGKTDTVKAGEMVIITPMKVHSSYTPVYCKILICVFTMDFVGDIIPTSEFYGGYSSSVFRPSPALTTYIIDSFIPNVLNYTAKNVRIHRMVHAGIHAILAEYAASTERTNNGSNHALTQLLVYMNEHFKEPITLKSVGKALGYSAGYLSHCLDTLPDMNFLGILNSFRIEYAKNLLLTSNKSNLDIALESGFTCERTFYRAFSKAIGMTPREYIALKSKSAFWDT